MNAAHEDTRLGDIRCWGEPLKALKPALRFAAGTRDCANNNVVPMAQSGIGIGLLN
jgi:hypothetical protein